MYARVSTFEGMMPDHIDEAIRVAREQFIPAAQQSGGFEGMYILADRQSGKVLAVTLWESEQAMDATEEAAHWLRAFGAETAGGMLKGVERYEVFFFSESKGPQP